MAVNNKKVQLTSTEGKLVQYQEQGNLAFQLLVKSQLMEKPICIEELVKFCLTPIPVSLATADGFFAKTNKANVIHHLKDNITKSSVLPAESVMHIEDGAAVFHTMRDIPPTFKTICLNVLDLMATKKNLVFSTDSYYPDSIKSHERKRRGSSNRILLEGPNTRRPPDMKVFLHNSENKSQLNALLLKVWGSPDAYDRLKDRNVLLVVEGIVYRFAASNGKVTMDILPTLSSNQEETDTRVILYIGYAEKCGFENVVIRSPDSDIFFILLHFSNQFPTLTIYFDTGCGKHRQIINISDTATNFGQNYCTALLGMHIFTGEDCTSAF